MKRARHLARRVLVMALAATLPTLAAAQESAEPAEHLTGWDRVTLDVSPFMMPIGFYGFRLTAPVTGSGRAIGGYMFQNFENDLGRAHAQTLLIGWQQYLWRGLEVEFELWPSYNRWRSSVDGKVYRGFDLWAEGRIGYRFDFRTAGVDWYLLPQVLYGKGLWMQYDPPGDFSEPFLFPAAWLGFPLF